MNPNSSVTESINERVLKLLGLEETFDIDYETYIQLLKERLIRVTASGEKLPKEDFDLLRQELRRVKTKETKNKKFKIQSDSFLGKKKQNQTKPKITAKKLLLPSSGALAKVSEVENKSKVTQRLQSNNIGSIDILTKIDEKLSSILDTLSSTYKLQNKNLDIDRKERENKKRQDRENRLESGKKLIGTAVQKILSPFQNIFERIWNFIKFTLLGRAFTMLMNWFADPKNKGKVETIGRFLKDWWPALLGAYGLFMTPFGGLVRTVIGTAVKWTFQITKFAIPKLLKVIRSPVGIGLGLFTAGATIPKILPGTVDQQERKTAGAPGSKEEKIKQLELQKANLNVLEKLQGKGAEIDEQLEYLKTGKTKSYGFVSGGFVSGESGIDKVPAMLSDGEFVMSRGAVAKFGTPFLEALNAAGGGTNKPKVVSGTTYAYGGGPVGNYKDSGSDITKNIKDFIKYKIGYDVDRPNTWGPSFAAGISKMFSGSNSPGNKSPKRGGGFDFGAAASQLYNQGESGINALGRTASQLYTQGESGVRSLGGAVYNQGLKAQSYLRSGGLEKDTSRLMQSGMQYGAGLYDQALKVGNQALTDIQSGKIQNQVSQIGKNITETPKKAAGGFFDTMKNIGSSKGYKENAARMEKAQDQMITLGDKFIKKLPDGPFKEIADKGLIPIPSGNAKTMRNLTFAKALLGPLGRPFKILSNKEVDRMRQQTIEKTMGKSGLITDPKTGQVKMNWNQEDINKRAKGGGAYTDDLGPRGAAFNSILGRFSASTEGKGNTLYTDDRYNFNKSVSEYAEMAKQGLMKGSMSDATYYGASMLGRFAQDIGWLNQRALGSRIEIGKIDRSKLNMATGKPLSPEEIKKRKQADVTKRYGQGVTLYDKPQANTGQPYKSRFARPKATTKPAAKPSQPKAPAKPKRAWYDPRGWVGKQGGGEIPIEENTGMDIPGATADRQLIAVEPGESKYIVPKAAVENGAIGMINKIVAMTDSDSTPAKLGYRSKEVPMITPYSQKSSSMTLPPIKNSSGGSMSMPTSPSSLPDFSVIPADGIPFRTANAKLLGIVA